MNGTSLSEYDEKKVAWWTWHLENPSVWENFEAYADQMRSSGRKKSSAWLVVNRIRWEVNLTTTGEFKISNDFIGFYARYYMMSMADRHCFFDIKPMIGEPFEQVRALCGYTPRKEAA